MSLSGQLVQGVDVWINTPRRPWEACGTSGMKVLVNGGINISELDGWWAEAYSPELGWALGDGREHGDDPAVDITEAHALYELLENEVIPEFYQRDEKNIPRKWLHRMRESMAQLTPRFSANRAVCDYTEQFYLPAAKVFTARGANNGATAEQIIQWKNNLREHWDSIRIGKREINSRDNHHYFEVDIHLNNINPEFISVQLYADGGAGEPGICKLMQPVSSQPPALPDEPITYHASVTSSRPASDFTPRLVAHFRDATTPLEDSHIRWLT